MVGVLPLLLAAGNHSNANKYWHSRGNDPEPQSVQIDDEEEWETDKVLDKRVRSDETK